MSDHPTTSGYYPRHGLWDRLVAARISDQRRAKYLSLRFDHGVRQSDASRLVGVAASWANKFERDLEKNPEWEVELRGLLEAQELAEITAPKTLDQMSALALKCLDDFELFRVTVFGRRSLPWAVEAAHTVAELYDSNAREFVVWNTAPGVGKTTLASLDIPAWITCRRRHVRGVLGSITETISGLNLVQLRTEMERTEPLRANSEDMDIRGQVDARYTMAHLYGRMRPPQRGRWTSTGFDVEQPGGIRTARKEHTWSIAAMEGKFISVRCDYQCWDDAQSPESFHTESNRTKHARKVDDTIEARLDAGGLLQFVTQRLHQLDLSRYCIDKVIDVPTRDGVTRRKKYTHIIHRAHDTDRCVGDHGEWTSDEDGNDLFVRPPAWPQGCLLDPGALPYSDLMAQQGDNNHRFELVYQQNDASHSESLVQPLWVSGGRDPVTQEVFTGCWDDDRPMRTIPTELEPVEDQQARRVLSYATVDPSVSQWWCVQWWLYDAASERRYLIDMARRKMPFNALIELEPGTLHYTGLMDDWQNRSIEWGHRITHWIVEQNSQQKHMMNTAAVRNWTNTREVQMIGHETQKTSKADPRLGVEAVIPGIYKYGKLRLPGTYEARLECRPLVDEATSWPYNQTTDCVMAQWFGEYNLPTILNATADPPEYRSWRPTWMLQNQDPGQAHAADALQRAFGGAA